MWAIPALLLALGAAEPDAPPQDATPITAPETAPHRDADHPLWSRSLRMLPQLAAAAGLTALWFVVAPAVLLGGLAGLALGGGLLLGPTFLLTYAYLLFYGVYYFSGPVAAVHVLAYVAAQTLLGWLAGTDRRGLGLLRLPVRAASVGAAGIAVGAVSLVEAAALGVVLTAVAGASLLIMPRVWLVWYPQSEAGNPDDGGRLPRAWLAATCNVLACAVPCTATFLPPLLAHNALLAHPPAMLGAVAAEDFVIAQFPRTAKRKRVHPRLDDDEEDR